MASSIDRGAHESQPKRRPMGWVLHDAPGPRSRQAMTDAAGHLLIPTPSERADHEAKRADDAERRAAALEAELNRIRKEK